MEIGPMYFAQERAACFLGEAVTNGEIPITVNEVEGGAGTVEYAQRGDGFSNPGCWIVVPDPGFV